MQTLSEIYERHRVYGPDVGHGDKGGIHSYLETYERILAPFRSGCTFMEIGLAMGLSLAMWREYMPNNRIIGVDLSIVFDPKPHIDTGTILIEADATKPEFLDRLGDTRFDVVIDDASHMAADQRATFKLLKDRMNSKSIYVIEDILYLEKEIQSFEKLHHNVEIVDLRKVKGRFDDVLVIYRF